VDKSSKDTSEFQFIAVPAPSLMSIIPDYRSFSEHFIRCKNAAASFENIGRDAILISPRPVEGTDYKHLANFIRNSDEKAISYFWFLVALKLEENLKDGRPRWLSTNGLGVHWLHVRIDIRPKYYLSEFRNWGNKTNDSNASGKWGNKTNDSNALGNWGNKTNDSNALGNWGNKTNDSNALGNWENKTNDSNESRNVGNKMIDSREFELDLKRKGDHLENESIREAKSPSNTISSFNEPSHVEVNEKDELQIPPSNIDSASKL